ncbi:hypothetical protein TWF694_003090 [Orbilia ellipsospora]|uniref:Uncharacterized protein n=1 Tax=Orbilia ellipsospora TaxID=2528407 RepID=A0AAV9X1R4_9PEZI
MHIRKLSTFLAVLGSLLNTGFAIAVPDPDTVTTTTETPAVAAATHTNAPAPWDGIVVKYEKLDISQAVSRRETPDDLFKRTDTACFSDSYNSFYTDDYWALENSFWSATDWAYLPHLYRVSWNWQSVMVCVTNWYLTENTHFYIRNVGDAMAVIGGCCGWPQCDGGVTSIRGDTGLLLDVTTGNHWTGHC